MLIGAAAVRKERLSRMQLLDPSPTPYDSIMAHVHTASCCSLQRPGPVKARQVFPSTGGGEAPYKKRVSTRLEWLPLASPVPPRLTQLALVMAQSSQNLSDGIQVPGELFHCLVRSTVCPCLYSAKDMHLAQRELIHLPNQLV